MTTYTELSWKFNNNKKNIPFWKNEVANIWLSSGIFEGQSHVLTILRLLQP